MLTVMTVVVGKVFETSTNIVFDIGYRAKLTHP